MKNLESLLEKRNREIEVEEEQKRIANAIKDEKNYTVVLYSGLSLTVVLVLGFIVIRAINGNELIRTQIPPIYAYSFICMAVIAIVTLGFLNYED